MTEATLSHPAQARTRAEHVYGWVMVGVAALAMVATLPGRTHGLGMITERLLADPTWNLSRTGFGQMNFWATLLGAFFCLGIGSCIDRFGIRRTLAVVMLALGAVVLGMTKTTSITMLFLMILLTRGFGQSALSVVSIAIVGKWFDRNVSLPMAVYAVLMAGGFIAAALVGRDYANMDWREFWAVIGWTVLGLAVVLTAVARDRESASKAGISEDTKRLGPQNEFTHREALQTPMFWVCSLSISLYGLIAAGISLFNESILVDQGFQKEVYYESLAMGTGIAVVAKLCSGFLGIYWPVNRMLSVALWLLAGSLVWLTQLASYQDVVAYVVINAVAGGMLTVLFFSAWPDLYGRAHLGKIQGSAQMLTVLASAVGPLLFAESRELAGSYHPLLWVLCVCVALTAIIAWLTPTPRKPSLISGD